MGEIFERTLPETPLEWTGERLTTGAEGQVEIEHLHRYFFAREFCRGRDVLDIASGEGYGAMLLAQVAQSVVGVDVSDEAVAHARLAYSSSNLRFLKGDARSIPLPDNGIDVVVSFETLEHFYDHEQFLAEVRRVLRPGGRFVVSSPERDVYSPAGGWVNPYHVHELTREEFSAQLARSFRHSMVFGQRPMLGSVLVAERSTEDIPGVQPFMTFERRDTTHFEASVGLPRPPYLIAVASDSLVADVGNSLYIETSNLEDLFQRMAQAVHEAQELRERLASDSEQLVRTQRELLQREEQLADKSRIVEHLQVAQSDLQNRDAEMDWLRAELQASQEQHALMVTSRSWKLTAPLREFSRQQPPGGVKQAASLLRTVYRELARPRSAPLARTHDTLSPESLPTDAMVLVAAHGDEAAVRAYGPHGRHFPQSGSGGYAGHDPSDSTAAIAHLEALRANGADFFALPNSAVWWLDHYVGLRRHLFRQYHLLPGTADGGLLFCLRQASALAGLASELDGVADESLAVLDWHTDLDLVSAYPEHVVFMPPERGGTLPYLDRSVDIVAVRDPDHAAAGEAHRVARRAVAVFTTRPDGDGTTMEMNVEREADSVLPTPSMSVVVPIRPGDPASHARLAAACAALPPGFNGELLVAVGNPHDRERESLREIQDANAFVRLVDNDVPGAARVATGDILVFLGHDALPLPDWLTGLVRILVGTTDAAVVGGRVVGWDGRLWEAGGIVADTEALLFPGAGDVYPDDPAHAFVREVTWCSSSALATWRSVFEELGGFDTNYQCSWFQAADYCLRTRRAGLHVYYQPQSVVVRLTGGWALPTAHPDHLVFAQRWVGADCLEVAR